MQNKENIEKIVPFKYHNVQLYAAAQRRRVPSLTGKFFPITFLFLSYPGQSYIA